MRLRSQLAVSGARERSLAHWDPRTASAARARSSPSIARDERIMAAAACAADLALLRAATTRDYPAELSCAAVGARLGGELGGVALGGLGAARRLGRQRPRDARSRCSSDGRALGFVVLVHDLSFVERREATTRQFLLLAFGVLAAAASAITLVAARLSWRGWSNELRRLLRGETPRPEFRPFLRDVRDLVDRLAAERETDGLGGLWTPQRLKNTLSRHLHGETRRHRRQPRALHPRARERRRASRVLHPASGLVTALEPVMRACSGVWVAHGSGSADRETVGRARPRCACRRARSPTSCAASGSRPRRRRATTTASPTRGSGRSATSRTRGPIFRSEDWQHYQAVNQKFADAVCEEVGLGRPHRPGAGLPLRAAAAADPRAAAARHRPHVLAHPLAQLRALRHLPLARRAARGPARQQHPRLPHPVPLQQLPRRGRPLPRGAHRPRAERGRPPAGSATLVRPYPISIEWPSRWLAGRAAGRRVPGAASSPSSASRRTRCSASASTASTTPRASRSACWPSSGCSSATPSCAGASPSCSSPRPSRTIIERYRQLNERRRGASPRASTSASARAATGPIVLLRAHHEPPTVFRFYRAADLCYVSSLHDGMNLVAKEFVAARDDERGVLVLSQLHRRRARADRGADRQPLRPRRGRAPRSPRRSPCRRRSSATGCARCARSSPSSTSTAGPGACWSTRRGCGGASGSPAACGRQLARGGPRR